MSKSEEYSAKELMAEDAGKSSDYVNVTHKDPRRSRSSFVANTGVVEGLYFSEQLPESEETSFKDLTRAEKVAYVRNVVAFFIFGLINNYPYVVFNSAATAILNGQASPGTLLLCSITPAFLLAGIGPWFFHFIPYFIRVFLVVSLSCGSFLIVAFLGEGSLTWTLLGVVMASFASGLGEPTFLAFSSYYNSNTVSAWSSGTGFAGVFGAFSWLVLHSSWAFNFSTITCLYVIAPFPLFMGIAYVFLLTSPVEERVVDAKTYDQDGVVYDSPTKKLTFMQRVNILKPLTMYMVSLCFVYFSEYCINAGVTPAMVEATKDDTKRSNQFTEFNLCYQIGVFLSRSSVNIFHTRHVWIFSGLQCINFVIFFLLAYYQAIDSVYYYWPIILYEGFMGGFCYVNAFYAITKNIAEEYREFAMAIAVFGSNMGIATAAVASVYITGYLCDHINNPDICVSYSFF
eukprot:Nk52_evm30s1178 gene=Nk52_evmTU30s1178